MAQSVNPEVMRAIMRDYFLEQARMLRLIDEDADVRVEPGSVASQPAPPSAEPQG